MIDQIPDCLAWRNQALPQTISRNLRERIAETLFQRIEDKRVHEALCALPLGALARVLNAPETFYRLVQAEARHESWNEVAEFMLCAARLEARLCTHEPDPASHGWTALGDAWLPPPSSGLAALQAPVLDGHVVVDVQSPHALRPLRVDAVRGVELGSGQPDAAGLASLLPLLRQANGIVRESRASGLYKAFIHVIQPRVAPQQPGFTSSSCNAHLGRVVLLNAKVPDPVDTPMLVNAMVHEAVHSFLYALEQEEAFIPNPSGAHGITLVSPWTGGTLSLHSYVHACFVWFALAHFWHAFALQGHNAAQARPYVEKATRGFIGEHPATRLASANGLLHPDLLAVIASLEPP